jgi:diaminohydroxyphosphoribosylaminopyrimidine deaminase/5-amino-6-(5-phosphoribosylamino)uracil reductase
VTARAPADRCRALGALGCEVVSFSDAGPVPLVPLLDLLGGRGMTNLLVEGGSRVLGAFFDAGEVDEVEVFLAPVIEGGSHDFSGVRGVGHDRMALASRLDRQHVELLDGDIHLRGTFDRSWLHADNP